MKSEKEIINDLLNQSGLVFGTKNLEGQYLYVNEEYVRLFARSREDFLGKTDHELFEQDVASAFRKADLKVIETGQKTMFEELAEVDGNQRSYLSIKFPVFDSGQSVVGVGVVATDVTDAKNLQLSLERHHEALMQEVKHRQEKERQHTILQSVTKIQTSHMAKQDFNHAFELLLNELIDFTDSEYGFLGEILNSDTVSPYLKVHAITDVSWDDASRTLYQENLEKGLELHNLDTLFGDTIATGEAVISNDPANDSLSDGLPEGHPPLKSYLGVPILTGDKFVGMLGISNRPMGYDKNLIDEIAPILNAGANLIEAQRNEARRVRTELALRESEKKFRTVFNSSHDAIVVIDEKGKFIDCNQAALHLFGYRNQGEFFAKTIVDVTPHIIFGQKRDKLIKKHIGNAIATGFERMEWVCLNAHGQSISCDVTLSPLGLDGKKYVQGIIHDNTEKQKAIKKQQALQKQLVQSQKMESIGHLTDGIANDFNNILGAVIGFAELSKSALPESETNISTYIDQILTAGHRAKSLVQQMLAFSSGEVGEPQKLPPVNSIKEAIELFRPTIPSSIDISLYAQDEDVPVLMDPTQLRQLIMNLIINSRDAMKNQKGRIAITLNAQQGIEHTCDSCHESFSGDYVEIAVLDDGFGIPKESLSRIFEPFFTTKKNGEGSGMGLSVVHGIVHANRGHIIVDSGAEAGTSVKLFFPIEVDDVVSGNKDKIFGQDQPVGNGKILVVDDEIAITSYLSDLLVPQGYEVTAINSPNEACSMFKANPSRFDVIISDQTMPELTGSELAKEMLAEKPDLPFILCTGYTATIDEKSALDLGIKAFMHKPLDSNKLLNIIRELF